VLSLSSADSFLNQQSQIINPRALSLTSHFTLYTLYFNKMDTSVPLPHSEDLEREIGGLIISGFDGKKVSRELKNALRKGLGGVILFKRNLGNPKSVLKLTESLRAEAGDEGFIVAIDHEGGRVMRLGEPFTRFGPAAVLGKSDDAELARELGRAVGRELRAVGINLNFSPVVDLDEADNNAHLGDRSFGTDPEIVARMTSAYIEGMQLEGVAACAKHFPGHGIVKEDSHVELPQSDITREELQTHLGTFRSAIESGIASIMTAHVRVRSVDPYYPATISPDFLKVMLREEMGYNGVIITDDLEMAAVSETVGVLDGSFMALRAGADAVLIAHDIELAVAARKHIDNAVRHMALSLGDIMDNAQRLKDMKSRYPANPKYRPPLDVIGCKEHKDLAKQVAQFAPK